MRLILDWNRYSPIKLVALSTHKRANSFPFVASALFGDKKQARKKGSICNFTLVRIEMLGKKRNFLYPDPNTIADRVFLRDVKLFFDQLMLVYLLIN
jgi:hypothetical protein